MNWLPLLVTVKMRHNWRVVLGLRRDTQHPVSWLTERDYLLGLTPFVLNPEVWNGGKSAGPRTAEGKARVALNLPRVRRDRKG